ncbi:MAG: tRNA uridine-5-carboxymethylaminomethyl(34) synthesis GTPase MnmE [Gammaproteobacteria bacterium]|nr:tRNA uridine-5-carboxymethylaminomethyl(34) synthesis GTPase MnmE [Gammaproteobacteria bacterium]NNM21529.1 tRNA uridine-5-carboxymethylaminomethyl(34) synthesis GTPase MnmE [Gammaproteobacteria bacterium]
MKHTEETIAAIATPPGRGGVGIVRVSGPDAKAIALSMLPQLPQSRRAVLSHFNDARGDAIDEGIVLWMPAPDTFTGEDVLELHGHGGPVVMDLILQRTLQLGARAARPGEFSERAFLNDRLDLAQAEAIADLIDSGSIDAARAAARSLVGELSQRVGALTEAITELRVYVEAAIDFPEEEIDFLADDQVTSRLDAIGQMFELLAASARQGALLRDGMSVVIVGAPNAGKSSLLNRLAGYDAAIVTDVPGTTRDVLREHISLDGLPLHIVDTAGLRDTADRVEQEGVRRARSEMAGADRVLLVVDATTGEMPRHPLPPDVPVTVVLNKMDLAEAGAPANVTDGQPILRISALTGTGFNELRQHLQQCMGYNAGESGVLMARRRHLDALARARQHVQAGRDQLEQARAGELLAEELRLAQQALGEITGEVSSDDLLGRIFNSFCIGK